MSRVGWARFALPILPCYSGWTYPAKSGWKVETNGGCGHLTLSHLGRMQMRGQARTWGVPTTCTMLYRNGQWFASITVNCEPIRKTEPGVIGIDLGCKDAITLSTGEKIVKPEFIKTGQRQVKAASKQLRRKRSPNHKQKIKASRRWKKQRQVVSKRQRKVTRQREDWMHKTTSNIVSVQRWGLTPKGLSERLHVCQHCGHTEDRDVNAAQVNESWARGLERASIDAEPSSTTSCGSMRQLGAKKRQKSQRRAELGNETPSARAVG